MPNVESGPIQPVYVTPTQFDRIGRIMVPVFVNGAGPYSFIVDTGASRSAISPRLAQALGLEPNLEQPVSLRGVTGAEIVPSVLVDEIRAGEIVLRQQRLPAVTPSVFADADGILGVGGLVRMCLHVDFVDQSIEILNHGCPRANDNWARARTHLRFGGLVTLPARIKGVRVKAIIDTGAERSLGNLPLLQALELQALAGEDQATSTRVYGATSHSTHGNAIETPKIYFGDIAIGDLTVTFGDFDVFRLWNFDQEPAILLGMDVLGTVDALMIDYRRQELRILPKGSRDETQIRRRHFPGRLR